MEYLKNYPDDHFDLAIVDPPYGDGGGTWKGQNSRFGGLFDSYRRSVGEEVRKKIIAWDTAPPKEYFDQLFRVSRNQIIWGGNYFQLPPTRCFVVWKKKTVTETFTMAMAEYAWCSFNDNAKVFEYAPQDKDRFHPTQKPVALYKWLLSKYANKGDLILDTHVGSASSLIACEDLGFEYVGFEIDEEYYNKAKERLDDFNAQVRMKL